MRIEIVKQYMRVDYDDDDEIIELLIDTVMDEMAELIPDFNRDNPTNRQKILILASVKELYDNREKRAEKPHTGTISRTAHGTPDLRCRSHTARSRTSYFPF